MPLPRSAFLGSMVFRLRLSYFLIFAFVIAIGLSSALKFKDIAARKDDLTERAIPLLASAQELVALLSVQSEQVVALRSVSVSAELDDIARSFRARQVRFDETIGLYQSLSGDSGLQSAAAQLFATTATLIDLKRQRQQLSQARFEQVAQLQAIVDRMAVQIEELRLDVLTELQQNITQLSDGFDVRNRVGVLSLQLNTLISFELRIEKMQDIVESSDRNQDPVGSTFVAENLRFTLRDIVALMNRLPRSTQQQLLAVELSRARALIVDENGILLNADALVQNQAETAQSVEVSLDLIRMIETQIAESIASANRNAQETSRLLDQAIRTVSTSNLLLIFVFAGGFVLVVLVLVELQLNRRIQSLIASVRRFATGNYDDDIEVAGTDELGEIADALRLSQSVARDLERSNTDLQSFAYAASHDLKTPLRAITDLAEWTLEDARDELSADNVEKLELLSRRATRLSHLLDGLLLYASVDGMTDQDELVDLAKECAAIADLVDPDGAFSVTVDDHSPRFSTAIVPFRQILNNLVSNAIKHHDKPSGTINVSATLVGRFVEINVADDGPGIPQRFHDKIFELFHKLESRDVVEGAGIGLALVKKLAERHGGDVRLKSNGDEERGAVFTVRLALSRAA